MGRGLHGSVAALPTLLLLLLLLSSALYSRWASTILSTVHLCSRVKPAEETWRGEVIESVSGHI